MRYKKIIISFLIFILILFLSVSVYADDYIEDLSEIEKLEYLEVSSKITDIPTINARHAIVYDRASRKNSIWKK